MVRAIFLASAPDSRFGLRRSSYCGCMLYCSCDPLLRVHPSIAAAPLYCGCTSVWRLHPSMATAPQYGGCAPVWRLHPQYGGCIPSMAVAPQYGGCIPSIAVAPQYGGCTSVWRPPPCIVPALPSTPPLPKADAPPFPHRLSRPKASHSSASASG